MLRKRRAGVYAAKRYRDGLYSWRRRNRWLFAGICGPFILAGIVIGYTSGHQATWAAGMITGGFMALWMAFREMPPSHVENWNQGAEGERRTEKVLRPLERAGCSIEHDVVARYGNYDHIAVSRAGVYLLETKNLRGTIDIKNGIPCRSYRDEPSRHEALDRIPRQVLGAAAGLKGDIERRTGHRIWVQAVVVFWGEFPEGLVETGNCVFIHGSRLQAWMESRPNRLSQTDADEIAAGIRDIAAEEPAIEPARAQGPLDLARA
jgi:hypothetical protein